MQETQETWLISLGQEGPLEEEMATHSTILAWETLWTEKPGRLPSMGSQRVRHDSVTEHARARKRGCLELKASLIGPLLVAQMVKRLSAMQRPGFDPWVGKIP